MEDSMTDQKGCGKKKKRTSYRTWPVKPITTLVGTGAWRQQIAMMAR